jgi:hypothetical protein
MPESPGAPSDAQTLEAKRRVWNSLPPEVRRDPKVRAKFSDINGDDAFVGMGDVVAAVAKPIARALGRDPNCLPCQQRQARLNRIKLFRRRST